MTGDIGKWSSLFGRILLNGCGDIVGFDKGVWELAN